VKRSRLRPRGARAKREAPARAAFNREVRARIYCEWCGYDPVEAEDRGWMVRPMDPHHMVAKSKPWKHTDNPLVNGLLLCRLCHDRAHDHRKGWRDAVLTLAEGEARAERILGGDEA